jgi:hypothetical protein
MWALFLPLVFAARNGRRDERCSWHLTPCADVCGAEPTFEGGLTGAIICSLSFLRRGPASSPSSFGAV